MKNMNPVSSPACWLAAGIGLLSSLSAQALHIDVAVSVVNGRLTTDFCLPGTDGCDRLAVLDALGFSGTTLPIDQLSGQQIFVSDFGDFAGGPFRVDDPGFISGVGALPANMLLRYQAVGSLQYWDPAAGRWGSTVPGDARIRLAGGLSESTVISTDPAICGTLPFCTVPGGFEESSTLFTASGIAGEPLLIIDSTDATGQLHTHLDFQIEGPTGALGGAAGAYLVELLLQADGLQNSVPFFFMFNRGLTNDAFGQALAARILLEELDPSSIAGGISGTVVFGTDGSNANLTVPLTGSGTLIKRGDGLLVLTGSNTHTGSTTVESGVLRGDVLTPGRLNVAAAAMFDTVTSRFGSLSGAGTVNVDTLLEVGSDSTATRFTGLITGSGRLMKSGGGLLEVTGALANTGGVEVMGGTLQVNGSVNGPVELHEGSRLGGAGTLGGTLDVNGGATVAPGNSIGTLNVASATFDPGSVLEVEVDAAGNADRIVATGTVTLNGGTVSVLAAPGAYAPTTRYTLIEAAGGVAGVFDGVSSNLVFLEPSLDYDANNVFLQLSRRAQGFVLDGQSVNQQAVAAWLTAAQDAPALATLVTDLLGSNADQANTTFDALGGLGHTAAARSMLAAGQTLSHTFLRRAGSGPALLQPRGLSAGSDHADGLEVWVDAVASGAVYDDAGSLRGFTQGADGVALGVGWVSRHGTRLGIGASALRLNTSQGGLDERTEGVMPTLALYASGGEDRLNWAVTVGAGRAWLESTRRLRGAELTAEPEVWQTFLGAEAGARLFGSLAAYGRFTASRSGGMEISESGAADIALRGEIDALQSLAPEFGLRLAHAFESIVVDARAGWQRELGDRVATLQGNLAGAGIPAGFSTRGVELEANAAVIGVGIASRPDTDEGLQLSLQADARLRAEGQSEYAASAGLRYRW
jgi:autotransporter-associated beta strand protein